MDEIALTTGVSRAYADQLSNSSPQKEALTSANKYNTVTYRTFPIVDTNIWYLNK